MNQYKRRECRPLIDKSNISYQSVRIFLIFFFILFILTKAAKSEKYYVDPLNGLNNNLGLTEETPFRSISKLAEKVTSDDEVYIRNMDYSITSVDWPPAKKYLAKTISQFAITWTFDKDYQIGQFANHDMWVIREIDDEGHKTVKIIKIDPPCEDDNTASQVSHNGVNYRCILGHTSSVTSHYNEPGIGSNWELYWEVGGNGEDGTWTNNTVYQNSHIKNGSMMNITPNDRIGYDSRIYGMPHGYDHRLNVAVGVSDTNPLVVKTDTSLVSTVSKDESNVWPKLIHASVLTILESIPAYGSFRPGYCSIEKQIPGNVATIDANKGYLETLDLTSLYPSEHVPVLHKEVLDNSLLPINAQKETIERMFERVWLNHTTDAAGLYYRPEANMCKYGRDSAVQVSVASLILHSEFSYEEKKTLLIRFIQLGIDNYSVATRSTGWKPDGGCTQGHKWPILFAGIMLDDNGMKSIGDKSGDYLYEVMGKGPGNPPEDYIDFSEDGTTFYVRACNSGLPGIGIPGDTTGDIYNPPYALHRNSDDSKTAAWHGTVTLTKGSNVVKGTGTTWTLLNTHAQSPRRMFAVEGDPGAYDPKNKAYFVLGSQVTYLGKNYHCIRTSEGGSYSQVSHNGHNYICIYSHNAAPQREPGVGSQTDTYWRLGGDGSDGIWKADGSYTTQGVPGNEILNGLQYWEEGGEGGPEWISNTPYYSSLFLSDTEIKLTEPYRGWPDDPDGTEYTLKNYMISTMVWYGHGWSDSHDRYEFTSTDIGIPSWGIIHSRNPTNDGNSWDQSYQTQNPTTWQGWVLAALIMNEQVLGPGNSAKKLWNHDAMFDFTDRAMVVNAAMGRTGTNTRCYNRFVEEMWDRYRSDYGPIWPDKTGYPGAQSLNITASHGRIEKEVGLVVTNATSFSQGMNIILTAIPDDSYRFTGWSINGIDAGNDNPITVKMDSNKSVTANFQSLQSNSPPVIPPIADQTIPAGQQFILTIPVNDPDGDEVTVASNNLPNGATLNSPFTWTPTIDQVGTYHITFTATDEWNASTSQTVTFEVVAPDAPANTAPSVANVPASVTVDEGSTLTASIFELATDADGDALTYTYSGWPRNGTSSQVFPFTIGQVSQNTNYTLNMTVSDGTDTASKAITITVRDVPANQAPVLTAIGNKTAIEGGICQFSATATDADGDTLSFSASGLPDGADFFTSTNRFVWFPSYAQAGSYNVTITVSDGKGGTDSETVTITVSNVNQAPTMTAIGNKTVAEGGNLTINLQATDPDGDSLTYLVLNSPTGASFNASTRTFSWSPNFTQAGSYPVTFVAKDPGNQSAMEAITITVTDTNCAPILSVIGNKTIDPGNVLSFTLSATDADGDTLTYSASGLPSGATFNAASKTFSWTPTVNQSGTYSVTFGVSDSKGGSDSEVCMISVGAVNRPPTLAALNDLTVTENQAVSITLAGTDPDNDSLTYSLTTAKPTGANLSGSAFTWTPSYTQAGSYNLTFRVTDGEFNADQSMVITVTNVNRSPQWAVLGNQTVQENGTLAFTVAATDPDNETLTYSLANPPAGASFNTATGAFNWTPSYSQAGTYNLSFSATDGTATINRTTTVTVSNVNRLPVVTTIPSSMTINKGDPLTYDQVEKATDPDGETLTYTYSGWKSGSTSQVFPISVDSLPTNSQYTLNVSVSDGTASSSKAITITVADWSGNSSPVLSAIGNKTVVENNALSFTANATDSDGDTLIWSTSELPAGAGFNTSTRVFTWTPDYTQAGSYPVTITVSDGKNGVDSETITINVNNNNRLPVLSALVNKTTIEGGIVSFSLSASDPDEDTLSYSIDPMPTGATFNSQYRSFIWFPDYDSAGVHELTVTVTDPHGGSDSDTMTITVTNINRAPTIPTIGAKSVAEGSALQFAINGTDPDGDALTYQASNSPVGATLTDGVFRWTPDYDDAGSYNVTFIVRDPANQSAMETVTITVTDTNRPPVLAAIGAKTVDEGQVLSFSLSATDPEGQALTYSASGLPTGASFNATNKTFSWTPGNGSDGSYSVVFTVSDAGGATDSETVTISVGNVNRPPVLTAIPAKTIAENQTLTFTVSATDPDGDILTFYAGVAPSGATFDLTTHAYTWTPGYSQAGEYEQYFLVTDGTSYAYSVVNITVTNVNRAPVWSTLLDQTVAENQLLQFNLGATDPDGDIVSITASNLPTGASYSGGLFHWTPSYSQAGNYLITFRASDGSESINRTVGITVNNVNRDPVLANIAAQQAMTDQTLSFTLSATDADSDPLTYTMSNLPTGASFNATSRTFSWKPTTGQDGTVSVLATVSDGTSQDQQIVIITVGNANRPPVITAADAVSHEEGQSLSFTVSASDLDNDPVTLSASGLPVGASFNGSTFIWTPTYLQAGLYNITFSASDGSITVDKDVEIVINNINREPSLSLSNKTVAAGSSLTFTVTASDPDTDNTLVYQALNLPAGAVFNGNSFSWTPASAGTYTVTFVASDGYASASQPVTITVTAPTDGGGDTGGGDTGGGNTGGGNTGGGTTPTNTAPQFIGLNNRTVLFSNTQPNPTLSIVVSASDADGDAITISASGLPAGATFNSNTLTWTVSPEKAGSYPIAFTASDGQASTPQTITITVSEDPADPIVSNSAPVFDALSNQLVQLDLAGNADTLAFNVNATDPDDDQVTITAGSLPTGASFNGIRFSWKPTQTQVGTHTIIFTASDGELTTNKSIVITVKAAAPDNDPPVVLQTVPAPGSIQAPLNTVITIELADILTGLDLNSVAITIEGTLVYQGDLVKYNSDSGVCRRQGRSTRYVYTYQNDDLFTNDQEVTVSIDASDNSGNEMETYVFSFRTEMRSFGGNTPVTPVSSSAIQYDRFRSSSSAALSTTNTGPDAPQTVCGSNGTIWAVWQSGSVGAREIYLSSLAANTWSFATAINLTHHEADQCNPTVATGVDGSVYVAWQDNRNGNWDIYLTTSDDGVTWSAPVCMTESDKDQIAPALACDPDVAKKAALVWQDQEAGNWDIVLGSTADGFATCSQARLTSHTADQIEPAVGMTPAGQTFVFWTDKRKDGGDIYGTSTTQSNWTNKVICGNNRGPMRPGGDH